MKHIITEYASLIFDCDGVVLNSNRVKTRAFYQTTLSYGEAAAQAFVDYHVANGGVSRYKKFSHFLEQIIPTHTISPPDIDLDTLLQSYAAQVRHGLLNCQVAESLQLLRERTPNSRWLIVSGGDQTELREVFATRGLADLFDGGIFGSPDTKDQILAREIQNGNIENPALFLGDSKYDYQAATTAGLDFLFISSWSEVTDWDKWCHEQKIQNVSNISKIASQLTASIKIFDTK